MSRSPREGKGQPGLFPAEPFDAFGPSRFRAAGEPVTGRRVTGRRPARLRKLVREHAPKLPGVYGMLDGRGRLVYVGKAKSLRSRLLSYFRVNNIRENCDQGVYITGSISWSPTTTWPIANDGSLLASYSWTGSDVDGDFELTAESWKVTSAFNGSSATGTLILSDEFNYQGVHYSCSTGTLSWTAKKL